MHGDCYMHFARYLHDMFMQPMLRSVWCALGVRPVSLRVQERGLLLGL